MISISLRKLITKNIILWIPVLAKNFTVLIEVYKDSIKVSKIEGGPINTLYNSYKNELRDRSAELKETQILVAQARRNNDTIAYGELYQKSLSLAKGLQGFSYEFIEKNSDSEFSLLLLETLLTSQNQELAKVKSSLAALSPIINKSAGNQNIGKKIQAYILQREAVANVDIGKLAPDFAAPTPEGKQLALNEIKGKATIIDFWASWCGPCRRENPNVVKVYNKYHDKGLEIISVSLDKPNQKQRWLDAIEKDKLTWHHVSNLKYFNDPVARMYNVNAIPATFILDAEGRIVAKKLRGKALEDQIASMLK